MRMLERSRRGSLIWIAGAMLYVAVLSASQQPVRDLPTPPPDQAIEEFETSELVNAANRLTADDLPRLRARADAGDARAQILMGLAYETGRAGLVQQPAEALRWFLKAAGQRISWAEVWAADFYFNGGSGVERDYPKALALYRSAAERGDPKAAFFVGQMFFYGDGVAADHREAAAWFRRALPADPELVQPLVDLADSACASQFCLALRQIVGAVMSDAAGRFIDGWDDASHEWESTIRLAGAERCGLTSSDRTSVGSVRNYFCDSAPIADEARGVEEARQLADQVAMALPGGYSRRERTDLRPGPSTFFARADFPNVRVTYNLTPGSAQHRVTLLVGP